MINITLKINGTEHNVDVEPRTLLVHLVREQLALTGTHIGCDTSSCGACTILVDDKSAKSCTMLAVQANGKEIVDERIAQWREYFYKNGIDKVIIFDATCPIY